jgi:pyruvate/2-oxoglutarate dehydrogenase complex dihydrolipoamide dehydrogenase (E3) component
MRISAEEFVEGGISIKESPTIAGILAEAGLTYISVSAGIYETEHIGHDGMDKPEGWKMYMWKAIKEAVNIPVIGGGGMKRPSFCEGVLAQGKADLIGLGRPLFADPEWPAKAKNGTVDDIRLCISCWECAAASPAGRQGNARCTVNAAAGREREFSEIKSAAVKKRVMVVGGGPGGMEAARVATLRGHSVTLYEKAPELGGNLLIAAAPPKRDKILWVRDYLATQLKKLKVRIELHTEVTTDLVKRKNPDVVVVATGSKPVTPAIPGIENPNVVSAWDILAGRTEVRNSLVAVIGGSMVGCETADYLAGQGNRVTIVKMRPGEAASDMQPENRIILLERLTEAGITILSDKEVLEFTQDGVWIRSRDSSIKEFIKADRIILAMGASPVRALADFLEESNVEVYSVGDCEKPRIIKEAIYEGSLAGRKI